MIPDSSRERTNANSFSVDSAPRFAVEEQNSAAVTSLVALVDFDFQVPFRSSASVRHLNMKCDMPSSKQASKQTSKNQQMMTAAGKVTKDVFFLSWLYWIFLLMCVLILRTLFVFKTIQRHRASLENRPPCATATCTPIKTLVVLGSGGHTTEMLALLENIDATLYTPLIYMLASTDDTSLRRVQAHQQARRADAIYKLPRSREVGQSYISSIFTTLWSFIIALYYVAVVRPDLLLCNGPGTCLPVAIATLWYRILGLCRGNIVFCESFCRVSRYGLFCIL
jgi:beta-1,4-N-acetylglucosaminyltransferase